MKKSLIFLTSILLLASCSSNNNQTTSEITSTSLIKHTSTQNVTTEEIEYTEEKTEYVNEILDYCAHDFSKTISSGNVSKLQCQYCNAYALSQIFDENMTSEGIILKKGSHKTWTFEVEKEVKATLQMSACVNSTDINGSFYSNSYTADENNEEDKFELDANNNGTPKIRILVNGIEQFVTKKTYRELGIYSGYFYFDLCKGIDLIKGTNTVELIVHDEIRYPVIHHDNIRLIYLGE